MLSSILSTKLFIPKMRDNYVIRKALVEKLAAKIRDKSRLTLVSAPAGYGKTTLVVELLNYLNINPTWISIDEGDNDPIRFLSYVVAALKRVGIGTESDTENLLGDINLTSKQSIMTMIINDIAAVSKKTILVLDDFHLITSPHINDIVKFLIEHQPDNFHLVIVTREDPRFSLTRLRAKGELTEVRIDDLRFNGDETEEFFKNVMDLNIEREIVDRVASKTEGWIAGLQLAGLSLRGCEEGYVGEFINEFNGTHRYIIDYLMEEVLQRQGDEIRDFLCKTSILSRMNGELCDALVDGKGSREILQRLEQSNLFIIPLDGRREWYRYHHLFADSLRAELTNEEEQRLHRRAALWFENKGLKHEAVAHGFQSGDMELALRIVVDSTEQMFASAQLETLIKWMDVLSDRVVREDEILSVRKAWALFITGRMNEAITYLNSLGEEFMKNTTPHNRGLALSLRAVTSEYTGQGSSEELAMEALKLLEGWDPISRISTMNTLGRAQDKNGKTKEASETFRMAYNEGLKIGHIFVTTLALMNLAASLNAIGRRKEAIGLCLNYIEGMLREYGRLRPYIGVIYISLSELYYDGNDMENALEYITKGIEMCSSISYNWVQNSEIFLARIRYASGKREEAVKSVENAFNVLKDGEIKTFALKCASALTDMLLRSENISGAEEYEEWLRSSSDGTSAVNEEVSFAEIRFLIHQKHTEEALKLLERLESEMKNRQKIKMLVKVYVLYGEAFYASGNYGKCSQYIDRAIELAEPDEYYRLFLDEEPAIYSIFSCRNKSSGQFETKLADYMQPLMKRCEPQKQEKDSYQISFGGKEYVDKLSEREIDILELLGKGLSNGEISKELYISINTTQWHISHIYSKLGVKNRTQAILRAKELGIL